MGSFIGIFGVVSAVIIIYIITQLRKVVPTNEAHVVQKGNSSVAYGKGFKGGNVYLNWAPWVPVVGISVQKLPLSIFDLQLNNYKAYDSGKVPFQVDITAFFEIKDPETAAQKVESISELRNQLNETLKGVVRKVLASKDIVDIMESRTEIKDEFYDQVFGAVKSWGIMLQNVEFMDIRDDDGSQVVTNIMMKKRSQIESESQIEVAENQKNAIIEKENKEAEARSAAAAAKSRADIIASDAQRDAELKVIENEKLTQNKEIDKERILAVQKEEAKQKLYESEKLTKEKELAVKQVEEEKNAEIAKSIELIKADEQKQKLIIDAQADKEVVELGAIADKIKVELSTEAEKTQIESIGIARAKELDYIGTAEAKNKTQMAEALNTFDKESLDFMKKELDVNLSEIVDLEKAKALAKADIKVISTGKNGGEGVNSFMDLFSANGGANIGAMVQAAKNYNVRRKVNEFIGKFTGKKEIIKK
ncbi:MAG: SPFH domain-containing protein [Candidatus Gracilibacteria bacterium]|nr:SPFH domain-containing protein [Candidatus Gracilibacteria bacterium]